MRKEFNTPMTDEWKNAMDILQKQAEAATFNIHACSLVTNKLTGKWNHAQRSTDVKREMANLRAVIGKGNEKCWIPPPLFERCIECVSSRQ